jgi:hypothetical protein
VFLKAHQCSLNHIGALKYIARRKYFTKKVVGFIINATKYKAKKQAVISFFEKYLFINENTIHYFIFLQNQVGRFVQEIFTNKYFGVG